MTSSAPVPHVPTADRGSPAARAAAMAMTLVLALAVLVVPGARAQADGLIPTTLTVVQEQTWWSGPGPKKLRVETKTPDGEWPPGSITAEVAGDPRAGYSYRSADYLWLSKLTEPGTYPVTVRYEPTAGSGYAPAEWSGTVTVTESTKTTTITATASPRVDDREGGWVDVKVVADGSTPKGFVELSTKGRVLDQEHVQDGSARLHFGYDLLPGRHTFDVSFYGDDGYRTSHAQVAVEVVKESRPLKVWIPGENWDLENFTWKVAVDVPEAYRVGGTLSLYHGRRLIQRIDAEERPRTEVFVLDAGDFDPGSYTFDVRLTGSRYLENASASVSVTVLRPGSTARAWATPKLTWGKKHAVKVDVVPAEDNPLNDGRYATGTVAVYHGRTKLGSGSISKEGQATAWIGGTKLRVGTTELRLVYSGDQRYAPSTSSHTVRVHKAETKVRAKLADRTLHGKQRAKVRVQVSSPTVSTVTGTLKVKVDGEVVKTVKLKPYHHGERWITLPRLSKEPHNVRVVLVASSVTKRAQSPTRWFFTDQ